MLGTTRSVCGGLCGGCVVAAMWETHGTSACETAEERREERLYDGLGEHAP